VLSDKKISVSIIVFSWLLVAACGYQFANRGNFPSDIKSISVVMFENRTTETGIEQIITNAIVYEITRSSDLALIDRYRADAVLSGVIESLGIETISYRRVYRAIERRVRLTVSLRLTDREGKVIWSARRISDNQAYDVSPDKKRTEQNRRNAISVLSRRLGETVYDRLTGEF
jgi:outer membrane lipopolysaccharide assembly protein LptE/RlpB